MKDLERKKYRNHDGKCGSKSQDFFGWYTLFHERELDEWQSPCSKRCLQRWPQNPSELPSALLILLHRKGSRYHATLGVPFRFAKASSVFLIILIHWWVFPFYTFPTRKLPFRKPACNLALQPYHAIAKATLFQHEVYWPTRKTWTWKSSSTSLAFAQGFSAPILPILPARWQMVRVSRFHDDCKCIYI